ncbi:nucleotidyltransferase substrate binding protein [Rheinheimera gaetbuli]
MVLPQLDLNALNQAVTSLQQALQDSQDPAFTNSLTPSQRRLVIAGVIQNFEFSYELCYKMLKRQLEQDAAVPADIDQLSFKDLIRTAFEAGLLAEPELWFEFRRQRNITSHTYDQLKAQSVYQTAMVFLPQAQAVLAKLEQRNA